MTATTAEGREEHRTPAQMGTKLSPLQRKRTEWDSGIWLPAAGESVEVRRCGFTLRRGTIETVMDDCSGFWLAAEGVDPRVFVHLGDDGLQIRPGTDSCT